YAEEGLVHPRDILRTCNFVLSRNVVLGPWIHTGSQVQHLGLVAVGSTLSVRARITKNYEHKGHRFVEIDALVLANETVPIARIAHTAIYRLRQAEAAYPRSTVAAARRRLEQGPRGGVEAGSPARGEIAEP